MRNPDRIDVFCEKLAKIWKENFPDWRFFQLISNVNRWSGSDNFYKEEISAVKLFEDYVDDMKGKKKEQIHLYIDIDGVLIDTVSIIKRMYDEDFSLYPDWKPVKVKDIDTWDFKELELANRCYFDRCFENSRYFRYADELLDDSFIQLFLKNNLFKITFVSLGTQKNLQLKYSWLNKHFGDYFVDYIGLYSNEVADKSSIDMSDGILIDDSYRNLSTCNAKKCICFGDIRSWNEAWTGDRAEDWQDVYELVVLDKK